MREKAIPVLILLLGMLNYYLWLRVFHSQNQLLAKGICCGFTSPIFEQLLLWYGERPRPFEFNKGFTAHVGVWLFEWFERDERALLYISQSAIFAAMLIVAGFGFWWQRPVFGAVLATVFPMMPIIAYTGIRWDIYSLQLPVIALALWIACSSRGFTRIIHCGLYGGLVYIAAFWSARETDNFILLLSLASIAFGAWMGGLWQGKDIKGAKINRWKSVVFAVVTCGIILYQLSRYVYFTSPEGLSYYFSEAGRNVGTRQVDPNSWVYQSSYWGYLYWRGLGPYLGGLVVVSVSYLSLRRRFPMSLFCGIFIPLLVLSWITKRNYYYTSVIWPLLPVVIVLFARELPIKLRPLGYLIVLGLSFPHFWVRLNPRNVMTKFADQRLVYSSTTYGGIFQTSDGGMSLQPGDNSWAVEATEKIAEVITSDACKDELWAVAYTILPIEEVEIRLKKKHPCLIFKNFPPGQKLDEASLVLFDPNHIELSLREALVLRRFVQKTTITGPDQHSIEVWARGD